MSPRLARGIAVGIVALSVACVIASIPVGLAAREQVGPGEIVIVGDPTAPRMQETLTELQRERRQGGALEASSGQYNPGFAVLLVLLFLWLAVGLLVVWRQPRNWAGWIFLITGAPFPLLTLAQALVVYGVKAEPGSVPLVGLWATLGEYALYPIALIPLLFLLYPDGHPPSRRWRWAVRGLVGGTAIAILGFLFRPGPLNNWIEDGVLYENPFGIDVLAGIAPAIIAAGTVIALTSALSTVVAVRQRFKRSAGEERQQMRWIAFVASIAGTCFVLQWVVGLAGELLFRDADAPIFELFFALTAFTLVIGVPAAYLVAIFRHGLWDLDVVMKKTLQYGIVLVGLMAGVGLVVLVVPVLFVGISGDIAPAVAIGAVLAAVFLLVRTRAQRLANRLVYGKRSTPYEVLSEFGERVGETYSLDDVLPRMATLLGEATGAKAARVWLRIGDEMRQEGVWPEGAPAASDVPVRDDVPVFGEDAAFEVRHQGELLGALTVTVAPDDPMDSDQGEARSRHGGSGGVGAPERPIGRGSSGIPTADRGGAGRPGEEARTRHPRRRATAIGRAGREARPRGATRGDGSGPRRGDARRSEGGDERRLERPPGPRPRDLSATARGSGPRGGSGGSGEEILRARSRSSRTGSAGIRRSWSRPCTSPASRHSRTWRSTRGPPRQPFASRRRTGA